MTTCAHDFILPLLEQEKHSPTFFSHLSLSHLCSQRVSSRSAAPPSQVPQAASRWPSLCALRCHHGRGLLESLTAARPKHRAIMPPGYVLLRGASTTAAHLRLPPARMPPPRGPHRLPAAFHTQAAIQHKPRSKHVDTVHLYGRLSDGRPSLTSTMLPNL
jgi:hypothetical protein